MNIPSFMGYEEQSPVEGSSAPIGDPGQSPVNAPMGSLPPVAVQTSVAPMTTNAVPEGAETLSAGPPKPDAQAEAVGKAVAGLGAGMMQHRQAPQMPSVQPLQPLQQPHMNFASAMSDRRAKVNVKPAASKLSLFLDSLLRAK